LGYFYEEPVEDHAAFDGALGMQDEDDFGEVWVVESGFYDFVAVADVHGCVVEVALDEALQDVEDYAAGWVVHAEDWTAECEG